MKPLLSICFALSLLHAFGAEVVVTDAAELKRLVLESKEEGRRFEIVGTVLKPRQDASRFIFIRADKNAFAIFPLEKSFTPYAAGDLIRIKGVLRMKYDGDFGPIADSIVRLDHGTEPEPVPCQIEDIYHGRRLYDFVRVHGTVIDAFRDETNPDYCFIVLACGSDTLYCSSFNLGNTDLSALVDAQVVVDGICFRHTTRSPRNPLRYELEIERAQDITVLRPPPADPFDAPILSGDVHEICHPDPDTPRRKRLVGTVAAVWRKNRVLLRKTDGTCSRVDLLGGALPPIGETIEAVGLPETDFYHLNLSRAIWRKIDATRVDDPPPEKIVIGRILTDASGRRKYDITYNSRVIRITGIVSGLPAPDSDVLYLACGEHLVPVDLGDATESVGGLDLGSTIEITGVCIMETENWRPQEPFPHVNGISVVLRRGSDLRVLARQSWWTRERVLALSAALLAALAVILLWNLTLRLLVLRKSRQRAKEQLRVEHAQLKTDERTRLSIELHDSLSQTLTGIALEMRAAHTAAELSDPRAISHLSVAERSLASCHTELRNCLWDLRHSALENTDLKEAIRQTIRPQIGDLALTVRCAVSRRCMTEETAHAILKILRELAANAANHGQATRIRIAGVRDGNTLRFSVRDNGLGFDPKTAPGPAQGHFGLLGINDRLKAVGGTMRIESRPNAGTRITVSMPLPDTTNTEQ